jgi:hypothetical protein
VIVATYKQGTVATTITTTSAEGTAIFFVGAYPTSVVGVAENR